MTHEDTFSLVAMYISIALTRLVMVTANTKIFEGLSLISLGQATGERMITITLRKLGGLVKL